MGMAVSGWISGRHITLHKTCQSCVKTKRIFILYNFQDCCIAYFRDIMPKSDVLDHPSYIVTVPPFCTCLQNW